jgi:geranylgeranyl pyrophosphate synthase
MILCSKVGKRLRRHVPRGYVRVGAELNQPGHTELIGPLRLWNCSISFALLHDDVMDESDLRRGRLAAHGKPSSGTPQLVPVVTAQHSDATLLCCW